MNFEGKEQSLLTFRVGPVLCCAPSLPVRSIITPPKLTHIAGSEPSQPGIFKHGSHIVKVIDLRLKFGVDAAEHSHPGNLIISISEAGDYAFWVDQILDVFDFPSEGWGNLPPAIPRGVFSRTLLLNKKIHLYSEFEKLSTISDLGYLQHYIQQLTDKKPKQTISEDTQTTASSRTTSQIKSNEIKPAPSSITDKKRAHEDNSSNIAINENKARTTILSSETKSSSVNSSITHSGKQIPSHTTIKRTQHATDKKETTTASASSQVNLKSFAATNRTHTSGSAPSSVTTSSALNNKQTTTPITPIDRKSLHQSTSYSKTVTAAGNKNEANPLHNKATSPSEFESNSNNEEEQSNFGILIFFILLLLLPAAGIYYYLLDDTQVPYVLNKEKPLSNAEITLNMEATENTSVTIDKDLTQKTITPDSESEIKAEPELTLPADKSDQNENFEYRADISQDEDEITITIHQPITADETDVTESVVTPLSLEEDIADETVIDTTPVKALEQNELNKIIPPEKIINEVTHIVVKGDTLWAIAKKYVKNPFLYPELARLSNIKNPHRIYPGNRVRIRFTKN